MKRDATVRRVTISLPAWLYERGEEERTRDGLTRSEFVARLYRRYLEELAERERVKRYAAAYARQPQTKEEMDWAEAAADALGEIIEE
jgi:metal-responsive CopG/Arc/MetJ family transcriptional regulator